MDLLKLLLKGDNVFQVASKVLILVAGILAGADSNKTGKDDLVAGVLVSVAAGLEDYGRDDYEGEEGDIVEGIISSLKKWQLESKENGRYKPLVNVEVNS